MNVGDALVRQVVNIERAPKARMHGKGGGPGWRNTASGLRAPGDARKHAVDTWGNRPSLVGRMQGRRLLREAQHHVIALEAEMHHEEDHALVTARGRPQNASCKIDLGHRERPAVVERAHLEQAKKVARIGQDLTEGGRNGMSAIEICQDLRAPHTNMEGELGKVVDLACEAVPEAARGVWQVAHKRHPGHVRTSHLGVSEGADHALLHQRQQPAVQSLTNTSLDSERGHRRVGAVDGSRSQKVGQEVGRQQKSTCAAREDVEADRRDHGLQVGNARQSKNPKSKIYKRSRKACRRQEAMQG